MLTAIEGILRIGELLLSRGAEFDLAVAFGETALSLAAHVGHEPFVRGLLAKGASTDIQPHGRLLADWIEETSGLPPHKLDAILMLLAVRPSVAALH
jgi:ankyrin repeat protein